MTWSWRFYIPAVVIQIHPVIGNLLDLVGGSWFSKDFPFVGLRVDPPIIAVVLVA